MQKRVYKRTVSFDEEVPQALRSTEEATDEASEISRTQGKVKELTRALAVKINKENEGNTNR